MKKSDLKSLVKEVIKTLAEDASRENRKYKHCIVMSPRTLRLILRRENYNIHDLIDELGRDNVSIHGNSQHYPKGNEHVVFNLVLKKEPNKLVAHAYLSDVKPSIGDVMHALLNLYDTPPEPENFGF
jgi:hypothetical protein